MTTTLTAPAACAVVVPLIVVGVIVPMASADPPKVTVAPDWKPVPFTVSAVPPAVAPEDGLTEATPGGGGVPYTKQPVQVPLWLSGLVKMPLTAPAACAVVVPLIVVGVIVPMASADPPKVTVAPDWKPVPFTVSAVPPAVAPEDGLTEATVGGGVM